MGRPFLLRCTPPTHSSPVIVLRDPGLGVSPHEAARVHRTSRQHGACEAASPCRFRHRKHRRSLSPEFRQAFALLLRPDKFVMSFRGPQSDSLPSLKGESDDRCRWYYDADRTVFDYKAEPRRRNLLCALGMPALTGGICGLQRGCCPRARNGAGTRLPRCLELAVFWCDGHCRRSNIEYPKQHVGLLDQSRRPHLGRSGSYFLHTPPRIHAALARCCRSGPMGARLDLYHTRLFPTASTTATISAMKLERALINAQMQGLAEEAEILCSTRALPGLTPV